MMRSRATAADLIRFFADKHFWFIKPSDGGGKPCFFHVSGFNSDVEPASGDVVTFSMGEDDRGRSKAKEVTLERN
jgi:cold shock CspA family protein